MARSSVATKRDGPKASKKSPKERTVLDKYNLSLHRQAVAKAAKIHKQVTSLSLRGRDKIQVSEPALIPSGSDEGINFGEPILLQSLARSANESESDRHISKKRRLGSDTELLPMDLDVTALDEVPTPEKDEGHPPEPPASARIRDERPLPAFPKPIKPLAPSRSVLLRQGLDQAVVEAKRVDWSDTLPINPTAAEDSSGLSESTRAKLAKLGINHLFAVQKAVLSYLLPTKSSGVRSLYAPYNPPRDLCVSAPTGSGKTLAYALPIIELLSKRIVTRLRALVIAPTRELTHQIYQTFLKIGGKPLKIRVASGETSLAHDQENIVGGSPQLLRGGQSMVDVLVCTPGRLLDLLSNTPNFTLQHLRYLVIDEADRLLDDSTNNFLPNMLAALQPPLQPTVNPSATGSISGEGSYIDPFPIPDPLSPAWLVASSLGGACTEVTEDKCTSCQKLLFSATMIANPSKLAALKLHDPQYVIVNSRNNLDTSAGASADEPYTLQFPPTLKEHYTVCDLAQKPLFLLYLVHECDVRKALVFTNSAESTSRLANLIEFFEESFASSRDDSPMPITVQAISAELNTSQRRKVLKEFKRGESGILVCSDLLSRGIDIPDVPHVVSYDATMDAEKYLHRVGRTARAGKQGKAWTLVEEREWFVFRNAMKAAHHLQDIECISVTESQLQPYMPHYNVAISRLKGIYSRKGSSAT